MLAILGAVQALRPARILESAAVRLRLADHVWLLTWRQAFAAAAIPLGLLLGMAGYLLHRRYVRFAKELPFFIGALDSAIE